MLEKWRSWMAGQCNFRWKDRNERLKSRFGLSWTAKRSFLAPRILPPSWCCGSFCWAQCASLQWWNRHAKQMIQSVACPLNHTSSSTWMKWTSTRELCVDRNKVAFFDCSLYPGQLWVKVIAKNLDHCWSKGREKERDWWRMHPSVGVALRR